MNEVADGVFVAVSRREVTTSTVVVSGRTALLVDPAWEPDELEGLADFLAARGWTVAAGIATHAHHDHLLWHPAFGDVPRISSPTTARLARDHAAELLTALGATWPPQLAGLVGRVTGRADVPFPEPVELVEHNGHAPGHTAVWLPERSVLLAGDMLSDVELPLPLWPDDLPSYLAALDILAPYVARAEVLVPGHGHPTEDPRARLAADRRYFAELRARGDSDDPRRRTAGMAEVHQRVRALVQAASA